MRKPILALSLVALLVPLATACGDPAGVSALVEGLGPVEDLVAAWGYTCVIEQGAVRCWGDNGHGQLGDATDMASDVPVAVLPPED